MTLEQIEQFELSSRSADSLDIDEAFVEYDSPEEREAVVSFDGGPVVLLRYNRVADAEALIRGKSCMAVESEESDFEDYHGDSEHRKQVYLFTVLKKK